MKKIDLPRSFLLIFLMHSKSIHGSFLLKVRVRFGAPRKRPGCVPESERFGRVPQVNIARVEPFPHLARVTRVETDP